MTVADALLLALGAVAVGAGALVVSTAQLVRAGLYLVVSLGAVAGMYLVMGAELVAWVQVLVYVGAVVVLLLFAVMLTRAPIGPSRDLDRPAGPAALIGAGVGFGLTALLADAFRWSTVDLPPRGTAARIGGQVFGGWVLPFEVLSILLLAALVGAIVLSRPDLGARRGSVDEEPVHAGPGVDESAEVVARLERIAARQKAAQARMRATAAAERAAAAEPAAEPEPPLDPEAVEQLALRQRAGDVVFGAHERVHEGLREREATPPEPARKVKSSTPEAGTSQEGAAAPRGGPGRPALENAVEGEVVDSPERPRPGRASFPASPSDEPKPLPGGGRALPAATGKPSTSDDGTAPRGGGGNAGTRGADDDESSTGKNRGDGESGGEA